MKSYGVAIHWEGTPNVVHLSPQRFNCWSDAVTYMRNELKQAFAETCEEAGEYLPGFTLEVVGASHLKWKEQF